MGTLVPTIGNAIGAVAPVVSTANTIANFTGLNDASSSALEREQQQALQQLQAKQAQQQRQAAQDNALERERIAANANAADEERRAALRRATARQRARFGAQGVSTSGGSSEAVLLGMFDESEDERARREELDGLRTRALDLGAQQQNSVNILQRSQLQERQRLDRELTRASNRNNGGLFGTISNLF